MELLLIIIFFYTIALFYQYIFFCMFYHFFVLEWIICISILHFGWCGYACWTSMVLDLLPYKVGRSDRKNIRWIRYVLFILSFIFVSSLFLFKVVHLEIIMFNTFIIGNLVYYILGINLAFVFKDNRAFCKYICPATVFLKPASYFSFLRVKCNHDLCIGCQKCIHVCPMDVDMLDDSRKRKNGTECILCCNCIHECPKNALDLK